MTFVLDEVSIFVVDESFVFVVLDVWVFLLVVVVVVVDADDEVYVDLLPPLLDVVVEEV